MDAVGYAQMITNTRGWTCDDCIREVGLIATQYSLPHISHHWKNYLSHQGYCHDEDLDFSPPEVEACQYYIHKFISPALIGLDSAYLSRAQEMCHYWYDGICQLP